MTSLNDSYFRGDSPTRNQLSKTLDFNSRGVKSSYTRSYMNDSDDDDDVNYTSKNLSKTLQDVRSSSLHDYPSDYDDEEDEGTLLKTVQYNSDHNRSKNSQNLRTTQSAKTLSKF